ncbi:MAG: proprotein convertase P-domain-containing protein [bacterium]
MLHATAWNHDTAGDLTVADPIHPVMSTPNLIAGGIELTYSGYGDSDGLLTAGDADRVGAWSQFGGEASVICYDPNSAPEGGQIVYFACNYTALHSVQRGDLLQNAVNWLLVIETGSGSISGQAILEGEMDHSGILIEITPGDDSVVTGPAGEFTLTGLFPGDYQLQAHHDGWASAVLDLSIADGQQLTDVILLLRTVVVQDFCRAPGQPIPDGSPAGISDSVTVTLGKTVVAVELFVDITHTYPGDLTIDLTSPSGTTVRLHDRSGYGVDDVYGWYPTELTPEDELTLFNDEATDGQWTLSVADNAGADSGVWNEWCLRLYHSDGLSDVDSPELPRSVALDGNYPNPFNPATTIAFSIPFAQPVQLEVFNLQGRRVATLLADMLPAGRHEVTWRGQDTAGQQVASGIYLYRLQTWKFSETRKMMLLK